mmetsp:Transcript_80246/g.223482  ORF Transcript_80246/g.223482 Transcript_80246/m.223482 type:complete len:214 (+) Transcript_80246:823-1464(+)
MRTMRARAFVGRVAPRGARLRRLLALDCFRYGGPRPRARLRVGNVLLQRAGGCRSRRPRQHHMRAVQDLHALLSHLGRGSTGDRSRKPPRFHVSICTTHIFEPSLRRHDAGLRRLPWQHIPRCEARIRYRHSAACRCCRHPCGKRTPSRSVQADRIHDAVRQGTWRSYPRCGHGARALARTREGFRGEPSEQRGRIPCEHWRHYERPFSSADS